MSKLLTFLSPYKWIAAGVGVLLLVGGIVFGVNHALDQARKAGRAEVQAKWNAEKAGAAKARAELSEALAEAFHGLDSSLQHTVRTISYEGRDITVRVQKEIDNDPRYRSAECSLTGGVQDGVNAARRLSADSPTATVRGGAVPTGGAAVRLEFRGAGER